VRDKQVLRCVIPSPVAFPALHWVLVLLDVHHTTRNEKRGGVEVNLELLLPQLHPLRLDTGLLLQPRKLLAQRSLWNSRVSA
jgi:hypothetical protein